MTRSRNTTPLLVVLLVLGGCASTGPGSGSSSGAAVITRAELLETHEPNLYDAVQRLRPAWLRVRGGQITTSSSAPSEVALYVDGAPRGTVRDLNSIPIEAVVDIRFLNASEAGFTFGTMAGTAGVLAVRTRM